MTKEKVVLYYNPIGRNITVERYKKTLANKNKKELAEFIYNRLYSRYIKPFEFEHKIYKKEYKNGFSIMANACLLIETLQSYKQGLGNSKGQSKKLFMNFFKENANFKEFQNTAFYQDVRCGILHQGETTGDWQINRKNKLPLLENKNINANKFMQELKKSLKTYRDCLKNKEWDSEIWDNFRIKMRQVIKN